MLMIDPQRSWKPLTHSENPTVTYSRIKKWKPVGWIVIAPSIWANRIFEGINTKSVRWLNRVIFERVSLQSGILDFVVRTRIISMIFGFPVIRLRMWFNPFMLIVRSTCFLNHEYLSYEASHTNDDLYPENIDHNNFRPSRIHTIL